MIGTLLAVLPLWLCADFDAPMELDGARYERNAREGCVVEGRFGNGFAFVSDRKRADDLFISIGDPDRLATFPTRNGSFVCWFRLDDPSGHPGAFFSLTGFWQYQWVFSLDANQTTAARKGGCAVPPNLVRDTAWHHFAATWDDRTLTVYLDGHRVAEKPEPERVDMRNVSRAVLRLGCGGNGRPPFGGIMDEIAVVAKALTADEVATLAAADCPLRDPSAVDLPDRNEFPNAAPPPDRNALVVHSWGGSVDESLSFRKAIGINCVNVRVEDIPTARRSADAGFWLNLRIENSTEWPRLSPDEIAARATTLVQPYRNLANWRLSLVNSEVYHSSSLRAAMSNEAWRIEAARQLGCRPEIALKFAPPSLDYKLLGRVPFRGVLPEDCASLKTLEWYRREGNPVYRINERTAEAVHALRPDVTVWSEPTPPALGLDMLSDWIYDAGTDYVLLRARQFGGRARAEGVPFMPSLSGSYHHSWIPRGRHPTATDKDGNPLSVNLAQSCDETMIKTWMLLGATRMDALSFFNAGLWEVGGSNAVALASDPKRPISSLAEPDFAERYGRFFRERFLPVAARLKGCPPARAKLALVCTDDCLVAGTAAWRPVHYLSLIGTCLARGPVAFDVLCAKEVRPEILSQYKYVIVPMLGDGITQAHYDALCAVSNTTKVITDGYCSVAFPNVEKLDIKMHYAWTSGKPPPEEALAPLNAWLAAHADELRREAFAWCDRDGVDAFTFVKDLPGGGKAVLVVNDRRENRSLWPLFCTDSRYRPIAAPNHVTLHVNLPGVERIKSLDLGPAEAMVLYCRSGMKME